jgi:hypothetical protein
MATEVSDQAFHSAQSLYRKLLGAFPDYVADFEAKLKNWQEAISPSSEFVSPSHRPYTRYCVLIYDRFTGPLPGLRCPSLVRSSPLGPRPCP